ncbi:uncharacterized protein BX664DRAFT_320350 [Halteromyces radiatus]|uniref:uncharacterized protein n=1 Tax=Halteromyces radiatus TaxID=101107 RepID=UPI00221E4E68|nr:uncharacterized protein BX664DRAFT_320350 [Halteromyces radiatus]KAI8099083.1 hypothetical protein BX664DRAFT_320350 [Halteromyces radiatus]
MGTPADFDDEEFGFRFKRFVRSPLSTSHIVNSNDENYHNKTNNNAKQKGKSVEKRGPIQLQTPEERNPFTLSPLSPYTSSSILEQKQSQRSIDIYTLSPEPTEPQNYVTIDSTPSPISSPERISNNITPSGGDVIILSSPSKEIPTSEYYTSIESDLPNTERMRQLLLAGLRYQTKQQYSSIQIADDDDDQTEQQRIMVQNELRNIHLQVISKLANGDMDPYRNQQSAEKSSFFAYAERHRRNEYNRDRIRKAKLLIAKLKEDSQARRQATGRIYEYHALATDSCPETDKKVHLGACEDYLDNLYDDQRLFYESYGLRNDDDTDSTSSINFTPSLQQLLLRTSYDVAELRQQLNIAYEYQKQTGVFTDRLLRAIATRLKRSTLCLPTIPSNTGSTVVSNNEDKDQISTLPSSSLSASPSSSLSISKRDMDLLQDDYMEQRIKKRRLLLGDKDDSDMDAKRNFEFLRLLSKQLSQ